MCDNCLSDNERSLLKTAVDEAAKRDAENIKASISEDGIKKINDAIDRLAEVCEYGSLSDRERVFMLAAIVVYGREMRLPLEAAIGSIGHVMAVARFLLAEKKDEWNIPSKLSDLLGDERH